MDIGEHFQAAYDFIEAAKAAGEAVLVHCHEGKSRSVTLVLAYLMRSQVRAFNTCNRDMEQTCRLTQVQLFGLQSILPR